MTTRPKAFEDYGFIKTKEFTKSMWCPFCYGSGMVRQRTAGVIPRIKIHHCHKCAGRRRIWVRPGSKIEKMSNQRGGLGFYPGVGKHNKEINPFRR